VTEEKLEEIQGEINDLIADALQRIEDSPPEDTIGMAVAFMVATDLIGMEPGLTFHNFFKLFSELYRNLTKDPEEG